MSHKRIAEGCRVYINLAQLPDTPDGTGRLVPLSPVSVQWGQTNPWDSPTPAVLTLSMLDTDGLYSSHVGSLIGQRITVRPTWTDSSKPTDGAVFDGFITDATLIADTHPYHITVTASDRMYVLQLDTTPQANYGLENDYIGKGYQWWLQGTNTIINDRLKANGITDSRYSYSTYSLPYPLMDKVSLVEVMRKLMTQQTGDTRALYLNRPLYVSTWNHTGPTFYMTNLAWDHGLVLTGASIYAVLGTDAENINDYSWVLDAGACRIDEDAELATTSDYYTQLEVTYAHRTLTNANATVDQRKQEATYYTFTRDGSRVVRVDGAGREGENVLTIDITWTEYDSNEDSDVSDIDMTHAVDLLRIANQRVRLPTVTVKSSADVAQQIFAPWPRTLLILNSKYESDVPATHGPWLAISGTVTYDAADPDGHWTAQMTLYPLQYSTDAVAAEPPVSAMADIDPDTFADADWKLGALRYVSECKPYSEVTTT